MASIVRSILKNPGLAFAILAAAAHLGNNSCDNSASIPGFVKSVQGTRMFNRGRPGNPETDLEKKFRICVQKCVDPEDLESEIVRLSDNRDAWRQFVNENQWVGFEDVLHTKDVRTFAPRLECTSTHYKAPQSDELPDANHCWRKPFKTEKAAIAEKEQEMTAAENRKKYSEATKLGKELKDLVVHAWRDAPEDNAEKLVAVRKVQDKITEFGVILADQQRKKKEKEEEKKREDREKKANKLEQDMQQKLKEISTLEEQGKFDETLDLAKEQLASLEKQVEEYKSQTDEQSRLSLAFMQFQKDFQKVVQRVSVSKARSLEAQKVRGFYDERILIIQSANDKENLGSAVQKVHRLLEDVKTFGRSAADVETSKKLVSDIEALGKELQERKVKYDKEQMQEQKRNSFKKKKFEIENLGRDKKQLNVAIEQAQTLQVDAEKVYPISDGENYADAEVRNAIINLVHNLQDKKKQQQEEQRQAYRSQMVNLLDCPSDDDEELAEAVKRAERLRIEVTRFSSDDPDNELNNKLLGEIIASISTVERRIVEKREKEKALAKIKEMERAEEERKQAEERRKQAEEQRKQKLIEEERAKAQVVISTKFYRRNKLVKEAREELRKRKANHLFAGNAVMLDVFNAVKIRLSEHEKICEKITKSPEYWKGLITNEFRVNLANRERFDIKKQVTEDLERERTLKSWKAPELGLTSEQVQQIAKNQAEAHQQFVEGPKIGVAVSAAVDEFLKEKCQNLAEPMTSVTVVDELKF